MKNTLPPSPMITHMLKRLNAILPQGTSPITSHHQLTDGIVILLLLSHLTPPHISKPLSIPTNKIIFDPVADFEVRNNLTLLSSCLQQIDPSFILDTSKIAKGGKTEILRLLRFLLKTSSSSQREFRNKQNVERNVKIKSRLRPFMVKVLKEAKQTSTEEEIDELHKPRIKLQAIIEPIKTIPRTSISNVQCLATVSDKQQSQEVLITKKLNKKVLTHGEIQTNSSEQKSNEQKLLKPKDTVNFKDQTASAHQKNKNKHNIVYSLFTQLRFQSLEILSKKLNRSPLSTMQYNIIRSFFRKSKLNSLKRINLLFFGTQIVRKDFDTSYFKINNDQKQLQSRKIFREICLNYYQTSLFVKKIIFYTKVMLRNKLFFIYNLAQVERIPQKPIEYKDWCRIRDNFMKLSQSNNLKYIPKESEKVQSQTSQQNGYADNCDEVQLKVERPIFPCRQPVKEYWSVHRRVLIAYELKYVYNKKPDFKDKNIFVAFINNKRHKRYEFDSGFLLHHTQKQPKTVDFLKIITNSEKYLHLKRLYGEKEADLSEGRRRLRQFVSIMLDLKNQKILSHFLEIYNIIVDKVLSIPLKNIRNHSELDPILDQIVAGLREWAKKISEYFVIQYGMDSSLEKVLELLRVTVYCFLAEFHGLTENELECQAFRFPEVDEKSTVKFNPHRWPDSGEADEE